MILGGIRIPVFLRNPPLRFLLVGPFSSMDPSAVSLMNFDHCQRRCQERRKRSGSPVKLSIILLVTCDLLDPIISDTLSSSNDLNILKIVSNLKAPHRCQDLYLIGLNGANNLNIVNNIIQLAERLCRIDLRLRLLIICVCN